MALGKGGQNGECPDHLCDPGTRVTIASSAPFCICAVFDVPAPF
jgi:hypothetical protein